VQCHDLRPVWLFYLQLAAAERDHFESELSALKAELEASRAMIAELQASAHAQAQVSVL